MNSDVNDFEAQSILPPSVNIDKRLVLLEQLFAERLAGLDLSVLLVNLIDRVEASALVWLGKQFSLFGDGWELAKDTTARRELIKTAIEIHRYKGTPWAIKQALAVLGFGDAVLIEHTGYQLHDGSFRHDGSHRYGHNNWWEYDLKLKRPITREQAVKIRLALVEIAPARAVLKRIDFRAALKHNGFAKHNGEFDYLGLIIFDEEDW